MWGDVDVVGDKGDIIGDITGVDVYGGAGDAREDEMGEGGEGGSEGNDETLGANRGWISAVRGENRIGHLHGSDVFGPPAAYLE